MSRFKGSSQKAAVTAEDLKIIADCYRAIQRIAGGLNHASDQLYPLMATSATIKACWAELSGAIGGSAWSYPDTHVPLDGLAPGADRSGTPRKTTHIDWSKIRGEEDPSSG